MVEKVEKVEKVKSGEISGQKWRNLCPGYLVLGRVDLVLLHGLATGENMEHVSCDHIVWY